uniref:Helitron helicase-like domain-containing protein n=1 Tax=Lactuca sativa TaxID=4236 RepID=A0A9R1UFR6_LACSA|nr:hypothetical protein LSAT_V11C900478610 [Lactuca sativa]
MRDNTKNINLGTNSTHVSSTTTNVNTSIYKENNNNMDQLQAREKKRQRKIYLENKRSKKMNTRSKIPNKSSNIVGQNENVNNICFDKYSTLNVANKRKYYVLSNDMASQNVFTLTGSSSSIKLNPGCHKLKRKTTNLSPIPLIDLRENVENIHQLINENLMVEYLDHGDQNVVCQTCHAKLWRNESIRGKEKGNTDYSLWCAYGKVQLPELKRAPSSYERMFRNMDSKSKHFMKNIRRYNSMFSFTSMGGKIDTSINRGNTPYIFRFGGQNYHSIGSLLPAKESEPKFSQTKFQIDRDALDIKVMLDSNNVLVKSYRMKNPQLDMKLRLIGRRERDGRTYNLPTASEVVALIIGDSCESIENRDIRISELHPSNLPLQYPLLFPYGDDGYSLDIFHRGVTFTTTSKRAKYTMREYFAFRIQDRDHSLFQQFLVDAYTMMETKRLHYIRRQQHVLRCESYENLRNQKAQGTTNISNVGQRVILPSSFTDVYTIKFQKRGLPHSHICLFMHSDNMLPTVEFIDQIISAEIPDKVEEPKLYSLVNEFMIHGPCGAQNMNCPCMVDKKCSKNFPKQFCNHSSVDQNGFPLYRRRDDGRFVEKSGVKLNNRNVVSYNKYLLKRYQTHINVEWCNQGSSIKYLFKYINKGLDRATVVVLPTSNECENNDAVDEITEYYDCRYLSACEAS